MIYLTDKEIGQIIKKKRLERKLTQTELGRYLNVQAAAINKYESGLVSNIKRDKLKQLSIILDIEPSVLIGVVNNEKS